MIQITHTIAIDENECQESFIRASGPGGQNVNKVATAVQLRFNATLSPSLPDDVRLRLKKLAGKRMTEDGILMIEAQRFRTQNRNRQDALEKLVALIRKAAEPPKIRHKTKPTFGSQQRRLETKKKHSVNKQLRRSNTPAE